MIKNIFIKKIMLLVKEYYPEYDENTMNRIKYGVEAIYLTFTKIIVILGVSFFIGILKETLILLFLFNFLRMTGFGLHASKSWMCWVASSLTFICCPIICMNITIPRLIVINIGFLCLICFYLYAPADTYKRALKVKKKRYIYNVLTCITGSIYLLLIIFLNNRFFVNSLLFAMIIETVLIHPLTYKLFKLPCNNYVKLITSTVSS